MYIFVYGTLKRGQPNHYILERSDNMRASFICTGKTVERYPLITATKYNVPFLLDQRTVGKQIHGEVYEIDDRKLQKLDKLEQYPEIYSRRLEWICTEMELGKDGMICAWVYFFHTFSLHLLQEQFLDSYDCQDVNNMPKHLGDEERSEILQILRGHRNIGAFVKKSG